MIFANEFLLAKEKNSYSSGETGCKKRLVYPARENKPLSGL